MCSSSVKFYVKQTQTSLKRHLWWSWHEEICIFLKKITHCYFWNVDFLLEMTCSLFFQIYTKKHLNITREQKRRNLTPSLAPCSTIYTSLWSNQCWVEGLAMEVLHVGAPPPTSFPFLYLVMKTSSCKKTFKAMQLVLLSSSSGFV